MNTISLLILCNFPVPVAGHGAAGRDPAAQVAPGPPSGGGRAVPFSRISIVSEGFPSIVRDSLYSKGFPSMG